MKLVSCKMKNKPNTRLNNRTHELLPVIFIRPLFETNFDRVPLGTPLSLEGLQFSRHSEIFRRT